MPKNDRPAERAEEGAPILGIRKDDAAPLADTDYDYSFFQVDEFGRLRTNPGIEDGTTFGHKLDLLIDLLLRLNNTNQAIYSEIQKLNIYMDHVTDLRLICNDFIKEGE